MNTEEFVEMTMAFVASVVDASRSSDPSEYTTAKWDLRVHLRDSYTAAKLQAFADGMAYQKEREREKAEK